MGVIEKFKFIYRGQFAACKFDTMEDNICGGHGNRRIATVAETLQYSPIEESAICWTSTKNLWTPEGVIVFDDPARNMPKDIESLMKLYKQGNPDIRYVKGGFQEGDMSVSDFLKNPLTIAQVGNKDLIDIVAQRANAISLKKAYILNHYLIGESPHPIKSTALDSWGLFGQFMHMYCNVGQKGPIGSIYGYMQRTD